MNKLSFALLFSLVLPVAHAKLPPPDDAAKAKAAEAAAKAAWQGKVDAFQLCKSQDRVAAHYRKTSGASAAKAAPAAKPGAGAPTAAACADPGPFVYTPPEQKPLEAAGAHSPAGTASSPPSTKTPAAKKS